MNEGSSYRLAAEGPPHICMILPLQAVEQAPPGLPGSVP